MAGRGRVGAIVAGRVAGETQVGGVGSLGVVALGTGPHAAARGVGGVVEVGGVGRHCLADGAEGGGPDADRAVEVALGAVEQVGVEEGAVGTGTVAGELVPVHARDAGRAVVGVVEAAGAVGVADVAGLGGLVGEVALRAGVHAGGVGGVEVGDVFAEGSAGQAVGGGVVALGAVGVAEDAEAGVGGVAVLGEAGLVAGGAAEPGRVGGGVVDAGVALSDEGAEAGLAEGVAAPVDDDELLDAPEGSGVGFVVVDVEGEGDVGRAVVVALDHFVPLLAPRVAVAVVAAGYLGRPRHLVRVGLREPVAPGKGQGEEGVGVPVDSRRPPAPASSPHVCGHDPEVHHHLVEGLLDASG